MGVYVQLDCLDCVASLSFGKPILKRGQLTLRLFSEKEASRVDDEKAWFAVQVFLFRHLAHRLEFRKDDSGSVQLFSADAEEADFDTLFDEWKAKTDSPNPDGS